MEILYVSLLVSLLMIVMSVRHFFSYSVFRVSSRILAFIYLDIGLWILLNTLSYYVRYRPVAALQAHALPVDFVLLYCLNPLLYFFYRKLHTPQQECFWGRVMPHFLPPVIVLLLIPFYFIQPAMQRQLAIANDSFDNSLLFALLHWGFFVQSTGYVLHLHWLIGKQSGTVTRGYQIFSVRSFRVLLFIGLGIVAGHVFFWLGSSSSVHHMRFRLLAVDSICLVLVCGSMADSGVRTKVPDTSSPHQRDTETIPAETKKEKLSKAERMEIMEALRHLMESEKPYLQPDCHMEQLAAKLNIHKNHLSYVINYEDETGYVHFVNHYRLQHALDLIRQGAYLHHKMDTIATMSGFSNRGTLTRVCKELLGSCPADYINEAKRSRGENGTTHPET